MHAQRNSVSNEKTKAKRPTRQYKYKGTYIEVLTDIFASLSQKEFLCIKETINLTHT